MHRGDYAGAIAGFDKAIDLEPENDVSQRLGHGGPAIILKLDAGYSYAGRGLAYSLLGNGAAAKRDFTTALEQGYSQAEIDEERAELLPAQGESIVDQTNNKPKGVTSRSHAPRSTSPSPGRSARPPAGGLSTMTKEEYVDLSSSREVAMTENDYKREFDRLGVDTEHLYAVNIGRNPRVNGRQVHGLYFNRNRKHTYLTLGDNCRLEPDPTLWKHLADIEVKRTDWGLRNIVHEEACGEP